MQTSINQRFKLICDNLFNGNISEMSRQCNINRGTLRDIIGDRQSEPRHEAIRNVVESPFDISSEWLVTGKGEMLISNQETISICNIKNGNPYYAIDFIGGFSTLFNDQTTIPAYYIDYKPFNEKNVIYVNLTGDSMKPELNHGDIIALKEATSPIEYLPYGEIYAIVTDDFRTVKRIGRSEKEGYIRLIPTNKQDGYENQDIPINIIRKIYHVLGSIKNL